LAYPGRKTAVKQQIVEMTLNRSGVWDIARVLPVSPATVIQVLKKIVHLEPVNLKLLQQLKPEEVEVDVVRAEVVEELEETGVEESSLEQMWSFVGNKSHPRLL